MESRLSLSARCIMYFNKIIQLMNVCSNHNLVSQYYYGIIETLPKQSPVDKQNISCFPHKKT